MARYNQILIVDDIQYDTKYCLFQSKIDIKSGHEILNNSDIASTKETCTSSCILLFVFYVKGSLSVKIGSFVVEYSFGDKRSE